jgi:hypothetical protein
VADNRRGRNCLCRIVQWRGTLFDHVFVWLDREGRHVLSSEPYNATIDHIAELTAQLGILGIDVTVGDRSPWAPDSTTLLLFTSA